MTSNELLASTNLNGWRIVVGYSAELEHGLMGFFPALLVSGGTEEMFIEMFICLEKETLERALKLFPKRPLKVNKELFLVNQGNVLAFSLCALNERWKMGKVSEHVRILTREDLASRGSGSFKWAPGLLGPGMSEAEFVETLKVALARV